MPSSSPRKGISSLVQLAAKVWKASLKLCGPKLAMTRETEKLYGVLRRSQQAILKEQSFQPEPDDTSQDRPGLSCEWCEDTLTKAYKVLVTWQDTFDEERRLFNGWGLEFASFSDRQQAILEMLCSAFDCHATIHSYLLVLHSLQTLGEPKRRLDFHGDGLNSAVNVVTARLMARGEFCFSLLATQPANEFLLWSELAVELSKGRYTAAGFSEPGFSEAFLDQRRMAILSYVMAIEGKDSYRDREVIPAYLEYLEELEPTKDDISLQGSADSISGEAECTGVVTLHKVSQQESATSTSDGNDPSMSRKRSLSIEDQVTEESRHCKTNHREQIIPGGRERIVQLRESRAVCGSVIGNDDAVISPWTQAPVLHRGRESTEELS